MSFYQCFKRFVAVSCKILVLATTVVALAAPTSVMAQALPTMPADGYDTYVSGIPHGSIKDVDYYSTVSGTTLTMKVYTPPGYDVSKSYGVVYCYQGIGTDTGTIFADWCVGAGTVCDNLVYAGKMSRGVIIVAVDDQFNGTYGSDVRSMTLNDAIPYIDSHYSTIPDADHRGVYGFSWGGGYAFNVGCEDLDTFHHISPSSAAPSKHADTTLFSDGGTEAKLKLKTLFISCGDSDYLGLYAPSLACHNFCDTNGIPNIWWPVVGGNHDAGVWRPAMWNFLQLAENAGISDYTLTYTAGLGGTITGTSPQIVTYGGDGSEVTAVTDVGYRFLGWSDGLTDASRTDTNVTASISVTANFETLAPVIASFRIDDGAAAATSRTVVLSNTCTTNTPFEYMASESSTFDTNTGWLPYSTAPSFSLSGGGGVKTVYFKARTVDGWESTVASDTIILPGPELTAFALNANAAVTQSRSVALNSRCPGEPAVYMASESPTFATNTGWLPYIQVPSFTLSAGNGIKTVYFKTRNKIGIESAVKSDSITLAVPVPTINTFSVNNGAAVTATSTVTLNSSCNIKPTYYMASESSQFLPNTGWLPYTCNPSFALSAGNGVKTVYFKVQNSNGAVSAVHSDTITLTGPVVTSFAIMNGAASTKTSAVTISNVCTGTPTAYMASESPAFTDGSWKTYTKTASFPLSSGSGTKTVYFKVKNAVGMESNVKHSSINKTGTTSAASTLTTNTLASKAISAVSTAKIKPVAAPVRDADSSATTGITTHTLKAGSPNLQGVDYTFVQTKDGSFVATLIVANTGNADAGAFHVALYFWTNATTNLADLVLAQEVSLDGLAAGTETTAKFAAMMPDLGDAALVICPIFAVDNRSEVAAFDASKWFNTKTLLTVVP